MRFTSRTHKVSLTIRVIGLLEELYLESRNSLREYLVALVGHYSEDCATAVVDDAICLTRGAYATCARDPVQLKSALDTVWQQSDGKRFFLGEWHTHPGQSNHPSQLDFDTAGDTALDPKANCREFILAISGENGLGIHVVSPDGIVQLEAVA